MSFFRRRPVASSLLLGVALTLGGLLAGILFGRYETRKIGEAVLAENPSDPLDGLFFIFLGYAFAGLIAGLVVGLVAGIVAYLKNRRSRQFP